MGFYGLAILAIVGGLSAVVAHAIFRLVSLPNLANWLEASSIDRYAHCVLSDGRVWSLMPVDGAIRVGWRNADSADASAVSQRDASYTDQTKRASEPHPRGSNLIVGCK